MCTQHTLLQIVFHLGVKTIIASFQLWFKGPTCCSSIKCRVCLVQLSARLLYCSGFGKPPYACTVCSRTSDVE